MYDVFGMRPGAMMQASSRLQNGIVITSSFDDLALLFFGELAALDLEDDLKAPTVHIFRTRPSAV